MAGFIPRCTRPQALLSNYNPGLALSPAAKQIELDLLRTLPSNRHYDSPHADGNTLLLLLLLVLVLVLVKVQILVLKLILALHTMVQ